MLTLSFYTRKDCALCDSALAVLRRVQQRAPFAIAVVDIDADPELRARYDTVIPVVAHKNVELARSFFDEKKLVAAVQNICQNPAETIFSRCVDNYKS